MIHYLHIILATALIFASTNLFADKRAPRGTDLGNNGDDIRLAYYHAVYLAQEILTSVLHDERLLDAFDNDWHRDVLSNRSQVDRLIKHITTSDHVWSADEQPTCARTDPNKANKIFLAFERCERLGDRPLVVAANLIDVSSTALRLTESKNLGTSVMNAWKSTYPTISEYLASSSRVGAHVEYRKPQNFNGTFFSVNNTQLTISEQGEVTFDNLNLELPFANKVTFPLLMTWDKDHGRFTVRGFLEYTTPVGSLCTHKVMLFLLPTLSGDLLHASLVLPLVNEGSCQASGSVVKYHQFSRK